MKLNDYELQHAAAVRRLAPECTVLLKKDGAFPLSAPGKIALYGAGARRTVKGGTGSGEVNSRYFVTIEEGLEKAGFTVTTKPWLDAWDETVAAARKAFADEIRARAKQKHTLAVMEGMGAVMPMPEYSFRLYGDGDTATAEFVAGAFKQVGYATMHVADGEAGLAAALHGPYDAAVVDIMLPRLNGLEIIRRVEKVAEDKGIPMGQVALAWLLSKPTVTSPIVGATKIRHLEEACVAVDVVLTPEEITYLEEAYLPHAITGHN